MTAMTAAPLQLTPIEVELLDFLSYVYLQIDEPAKAAALLSVRQAHAETQPGQLPDTRAAIALAVARTRNAQPRKALRVLQDLAQRCPAVLGDASYHLTRAQALSAAGEHDAAVVAMRTYVERRPASLAAMGDQTQATP